VRVEDDPVTGRRRLRKGLDPDKDQSYFLYDLTPEQLAAARFPVGALTKPQVRAHARRASLPTADKEESQEICFVPQGTRAGEFVAHEAGALGLALPAARGRIENARGETLGAHEGHFRFTIGQRRGIGVSSTERLYVIAVDAQENRVVVGSADELASSEASVGDLRVLAGEIGAPFRAAARVRHRAPEVPATVHPDGRGNARVVFDAPVKAVAPGQSCVFYEGDVVLGGGVIRK
jgi:tRNA-specific 2-thiouridylase